MRYNYACAVPQPPLHTLHGKIFAHIKRAAANSSYLVVELKEGGGERECLLKETQSYEVDIQYIEEIGNINT